MSISETAHDKILHISTDLCNTEAIKTVLQQDGKGFSIVARIFAAPNKREFKISVKNDLVDSVRLMITELGFTEVTRIRN